MSKTYKVKCVLEGKSFVMPEWTVKKHEELLEAMIPFDEKLSNKVISQGDYDKAYRIEMILLSLREVDPKIKESDLKALHPDDFIELWIAVYNTGKRGIKSDESDFQKGEENPKSK